jgi:hypothetical protein
LALCTFFLVIWELRLGVPYCRTTVLAPLAQTFIFLIVGLSKDQMYTGWYWFLFFSGFVAFVPYVVAKKMEESE